jgi:carbonic anhydrase
MKARVEDSILSCKHPLKVINLHVRFGKLELLAEPANVSSNHLIDQNRAWSQKILKTDPQFFEKLSHQQTPEYLWIGCSDSRVPANEIIGLLPGEIFVHRNVANLVVHTDFNCLSVIQYAIAVLKVKHIIVCGHYGCGGVQAVFERRELGLIDNWLRHLKDVFEKHESQLTSIEDSMQRFDRLGELNVVEQVYNICHTTLAQTAWKSGQSLSVHGWIYRLSDGLIRDLEVTVSSVHQIEDIYRTALKNRPKMLQQSKRDSLQKF